MNNKIYKAQIHKGLLDLYNWIHEGSECDSTNQELFHCQHRIQIIFKLKKRVE